MGNKYSDFYFFVALLLSLIIKSEEPLIYSSSSDYIFRRTRIEKGFIETANVSVVNYLAKRDNLPEEGVDLIMVLGSPDTKVAYNVAKLYNQGSLELKRGGKILISGGGEINGEKEADVFKAILITQGVPEDIILVENKSKNTAQNMGFSKAIIDKLSPESIILIQTPFAQMEAEATFKKYFQNIDVYSYAPYIPAISGDADVETALKSIYRLLTWGPDGKNRLAEVRIPNDIFYAAKSMLEGLNDKGTITLGTPWLNKLYAIFQQQSLWRHKKFKPGFVDELNEELVGFGMPILKDGSSERKILESYLKSLDDTLSEEALMGKVYNWFAQNRQSDFDTLVQKWVNNNRDSNMAALNIWKDLNLNTADWQEAIKALIFADNVDYNGSFTVTADDFTNIAELAIDDSGSFQTELTKLIEKGGHYLHVANNNGGIVFDLKILAERLILEYLKGQGIQINEGNSTEDIMKKVQGIDNFSVTFAVRSGSKNNENVMRSEVREQDIDDLLNNSEFKILKAFKKAGLFKVVVKNEVDRGLGVDVSKPSPEFEEAIDNADLIGIKGGINAIGMQLLKKESYVFGVSSEVRTQYFTGLAWDEESNPMPDSFLVKILPGIKAAEKFYTDEATEQNLAQFVTARQNAEGKYSSQELLGEICKMRLHEANFIAWFMPELLGKTPEAKQAFRDINSKMVNSGITFSKALENYVEDNNLSVLDYSVLELNKYFNRRIAERLLGNIGGSIGRAVYKLDGQKVTELADVDAYRKERSNWSKVIVDFIVTPLGEAEQNLDINFAYTQGRQLVSPLGNLQDGSYVTFNAGYFWTAKLNREFNTMSTDTNLVLGDDFVGGFIGFLKEGDKTYAPLYNKGAMGRGQNGEIFFGRVKMESGKVTKINNRSMDGSIDWVAFDTIKDLNNVTDIEAIAFTPLYEKVSSPGTQNPYNNGQVNDTAVTTIKEAVANSPALFTPDYKDRIQLIIIEDRIVAMGRGQTVIPPNGWVLSLTEEAYEKLPLDVKEKLEAANLQNRVIASKSNSLEIKFELEFSDNCWNTAKMVLGDLTLLINDRESVPSNYYQDIYQRLEEEGSSLISSRRTQETDFAHVQDGGPRQIIGTAKVNGEEKFFVFTFNGRTGYSGGVNFDQALNIMQLELRKIDSNAKIEYAFNLDGGSSVSLMVFENKIPYVLNIPGPGPNSKANQVRGVNSYFELNLPL